MTDDHRARNDASRARLAAIAARVAAGDPTLPTVGGWTPVAILGHLAFWDRFVLGRWRRADGDGTPTPAELPSGFGQLINDAAEAQWAALEPAAAAAIAVAAAEEVDAYVAGLAAERVAALEATGMTRLAVRAHHRALHLDELEGIEAPPH